MSTSSIDVELLLDRLLSASTPSDCVTSLEQLRSQCRRRKQLRRDPKNDRPSRQQPDDNDDAVAEKEEEERQYLAIDTILANYTALNAICSLVAQSTLPSSNKMEVEGGDVAACELLLELLPSSSTPTLATANKKSSSSSSGKGGTTTKELQSQRQLKRRTESVAKTLLHFHEENDKNGGSNALDDNNITSLALIPSLLDCLCSSSSAQTTTYARVLSLQILQSFLSASPGALREQLMKAPDGINRLVDLLGYSSMAAATTTTESNDENSSVPEEVRNEAILFLTSLASSSSVLARLVTFSEGYDRALKIALASKGGGLSIAMDCLELCLALANADDVSRELFLGGGDGRGNLDRLAHLLDLRRGERFISKEKNIWWEKELKRKQRPVSTISDGRGENNLAVGKSQKQSSKGKGTKRGKQRKGDDDDLDDILRGAGASSADRPKESTLEIEIEEPNVVDEGPPTPYLTPNEAAIVDSVFNLLLVLLYDGEYSKSGALQPLTQPDGSRSKRRSRAKTIVSHDILTRSIVDCALYSLPPSGYDFVSAVPTPSLQLKALTTMAVLGSIGDTIDDRHSEEDETLQKKETKEETEIQTHLLFETMPLYLRGRVTAMERLLFLCCTGAYTPKPDGNYDDENSPEAIASSISTNAVATFRSCLPSEMSSRMLLHALAPPPPEEADENGAPLQEPEVARLVSTLVFNLGSLRMQQQEDLEMDVTDVCRAAICVAGSAGALGVILTKGDGDTNRELLLRMAPPSHGSEDSEPSASTLIEFILQNVARYEYPSTSDTQSSNAKLHASYAYVTISLLKLLSEWVFEMPKAVSQVLSSPSSVSLGILIRSRKADHDNKNGSNTIQSIDEAVPAMSGLLLGLCLEYMVDSQLASDASEENAAWTIDTIMSLIQSMGVGKYLSLIDEWKSKPIPMPYCFEQTRSNIERRSFLAWYSQSVTLIRRRIVVTLAGSGDDNDSDASDTEETAAGTQAARSLKKMIKSQAQQIEELQSKLENSLMTISTQTSQINELKRIAELGTSAETNDVLSEYAEKVSELEKEKLELVNESKRIEKIHERAVAAKESEIAGIKEGLCQTETSLSEMQRERDTLREEIAGLSSAYNMLENEYRSGSSGQSEMTAGGETPAEDGDRRSSIDQRLKSLQDENSRLNDDVRAANEWMSMAVSRMNDMETEIESFRSRGESDAVKDESSSELDSLRHELDRIRQESLTMKAEAEATLAAKDSELAKNEVLVRELEERIHQSANMGGETSNATVGELQEENRSLTAERDGLQSNLNEFQEWAGTAQSRIAEVEAQLSEVSGERDELKRSIQEMQASNVADEQKSVVNDQENEELKAQVAALTSERDSLLSQLKGPSSEDEQPDSTKDDLRAVVDELKEQNASLTAERDGLQSNLNEFQEWAGTAQSRIAEVEAQLSEVSGERDELKRSIQEMQASNVADEQKSVVNDQENEELTAQVAALTSERDSLLSQLKEPSSEDEQPDSTKDDLQAVVDELKEQNASLTVERDGLQSNLNEFQEWTGTAQSRIAEVEAQLSEVTEERDTCRASLDELHAFTGNDSFVAEQAEEILKKDEEINNLKTQIEEAQTRSSGAAGVDEIKLNELRSELQVEKGRVDALLQKDADAQALLNVLKSEKEELLGKLSKMESEMESMSSNEDTDRLLLEARGRIVELEEASNIGRDEIIAITAEREDLQTQLNDAIGKYEQMTKSVDDMKMEVHNFTAKNRALEQDNKILEQQLADALEKNMHTGEQESELKAKDNLLATAYSDLEALQKELIDRTRSSDDVVQQWKERTEALEETISSLEAQLETQEQEATEVISQWESRCSSLEENGSDVIRQWEERVQALEADITSLESQLDEKDNEAMEAISQWEARCSDLESSLKLKDDENEILVQNYGRKDETNAALDSQLKDLESQQKSQASEIQRLKEQIEERDDTILSYVEQVKELAAELVETRDQSEQVVKQWQERSDHLEANITELEETITEQESHATDAISQWEERCTALHEQIQGLELQLQDTTQVDKLETALKDSNEKLEDKEAELSCANSELDKAKDLLAQKEEGLKLKLEEEKLEAEKESNKSKALIFELQEELRNAREELQSVVTDQYSAKATEIATEALRQQMTEIRSQYTVDQEALAHERDVREAAEDEVERLKSDLALLAQANEYDDDIDVHVRKVAKKIAADNVLKERKEMEELRSALDRLKEELGSCRWREREAEEKATNARLQMSILEQEVSAARSDITLMEQALEELENSRIDFTVSHDYRIETLENERISVGNAYEEEINALKAELAQTNQEKDKLAHKLEQSERANTALVYSTTHDGATGEESESEVVRLQLERAQLLARIDELGTNLERRVSEAVAAHAATAEAELIMEKQLRNSVETSLADALSKITEMKPQTSSPSKSNDDELSSYKRLLNKAHIENDDLKNDIKLLQSKISKSTDNSNSLVDELREKLRKAEEQLRSVERESRFEAALASEISNLRAGATRPSSNGNKKNSLVLRGLSQQRIFDSAEEGNGSTAHNAAYIIEMYDYVVELKQSIEEERQMYKDLVVEHEDLLALLGQAGLDGTYPVE